MAYGGNVQIRYHAMLLKNVAITDINAGIVTKLKEAMSKWRKYSKADEEVDRTELTQVLVIACSTALTSGCHGEGPHPASQRAASIAAQTSKLVMDPPGL
jgi:hypothetical protein